MAVRPATIRAPEHSAGASYSQAMSVSTTHPSMAAPAQHKEVAMHPAKPSIATWIILLLGVFMVVTPWIFGFSGLEIVNAVADGLAIILVSLLALTTYRRLTGGWVSFVLLSMVLGMES